MWFHALFARSFRPKCNKDFPPYHTFEVVGLYHISKDGIPFDWIHSLRGSSHSASPYTLWLALIPLDWLFVTESVHLYSKALKQHYGGLRENSPESNPACPGCVHGKSLCSFEFFRIIRTKVQQPFHPSSDGTGTPLSTAGHTIGKNIPTLNSQYMCHQ